MKTAFSSVRMMVLLGVLTMLLSACAVGQPAQPTQPALANSYDSLVERLKGLNATVEAAGEATGPFFSVPGKVIKVNGAEVRVLEYESEAAAMTDAAKISANGSQIGGAMIKWAGSPHFYRQSKMIVLYVGDDSQVRNLLDAALGPQFAGM